MADLLAFLNEHYSGGPFTMLEPLETNGQRKAYALQGTNRKLVAKLTDPGRPEGVVRADVGTPEYLCAQGFPAPRPLAARGGDLYLPFENRFAYMYEYIEGRHAKPGGAFYPRLGDLLGHLHSIPIDGQVPPSSYVPGEILDQARGMLERANGFVGEPDDLPPEQFPTIVPELLEMIATFPAFDGLPRGIIHTDPYFVNLIETPEGALYLIDWEDGGIGYPLLDVGYVLAFLCAFTERDRITGGVPGPEKGIVSRTDWARAFLAGYQAVRPLSAEERVLLPDAIRLGFLAYMVDWETGAVIFDNYRRMKCFDAPMLATILE